MSAPRCPNPRPGINLLRLTCVLAFTATWVAFVLSSLVVASTVAWSDGCNFLDHAATRGWETAGLDGLSAGVRQRSVFPSQKVYGLRERAARTERMVLLLRHGSDY